MTIATEIATPARRGIDWTKPVLWLFAAVLMPGLSPAEALAVAETIRLKVELWSEAPQVTTVSVGVASLTPSATTDWADLIGMADKALYAAKANGRNCSILATIPRLTLAA